MADQNRRRTSIQLAEYDVNEEEKQVDQQNDSPQRKRRKSRRDGAGAEQQEGEKTDDQPKKKRRKRKQNTEESLSPRQDQVETNAQENRPQNKSQRQELKPASRENDVQSQQAPQLQDQLPGNDQKIRRKKKEKIKRSNSEAFAIGVVDDSTKAGTNMDDSRLSQSDVRGSKSIKSKGSKSQRNQPQGSITVKKEQTFKEFQKKMEEKEKPEGDSDGELRIKNLAVDLGKKTELNEQYLKRQFLKEQSKFDATQGQCCCCYGNRRGVRCIIYWDCINIFTPWRQILAIWLLCFHNAKPIVYRTYSVIRQISFWFQSLTLFMALAGYILWVVYEEEAEIKLLTSGFVLAFVLSFISLIDYHFTKVVTFYAKHPSERKVKINWLMTDSEPEFAFQRETNAKENIGVALPDLHIFEQADQVIKAVERGNDDEIDYDRNPLARQALNEDGSQLHIIAVKNKSKFLLEKQNELDSSELKQDSSMLDSSTNNLDSRMNIMLDNTTVKKPKRVRPDKGSVLQQNTDYQNGLNSDEEIDENNIDQLEEIPQENALEKRKKLRKRPVEDNQNQPSQDYSANKRARQLDYSNNP